MKSRSIGYLLLLQSFFGVRYSSAFAEDIPEAPLATRPSIVMDATVGGDSGDDLTKIKGTMTIADWTSSDQSLRCFILPFNDPNYGDDRGATNRVDILGPSSRSVLFRGGETAVSVKAPFVVEFGPATVLFRVRLPPGFAAGDGIQISFESTLPRQPGETTADYFYEGWYPQPLAKCPSADSDAELDPNYFRSGIAADLKAKILYPKSWDFVGPSDVASAPGTALVSLTANNLAFVLGNNYKHETFIAADVPVNVFYHSSSFRDLLPTIETALTTQSSLFGRFPFQSLSVVETTELQKYGLPGLIAVNHPRQSLFSRLQDDLLNWSHWMVAALSASQWYGAAIRADTIDDKWLIDGIVDFAAFEALAQLPQRFDLFNPLGPANSESGYKFLSFDYLQMVNVTAASLRRAAPFATLTTTTFQAVLPARQQNSFLFIKQAIALRQLRYFAGTASFDGFLRNLSTAHLHKELSPKAFHDFLMRLPSPFSPTMRQSLEKSLDSWWIDEGWPDFALQSFEKELLPNGKWLAHVSVGQEGEIDFPPSVGILDDHGHTSFVRANKPRGHAESQWRAELITDAEPQEAVVDPKDEAFDSNRFNNSNRWPDISFFPGGANTLRDDAYTVLWLPYAFRHPGEPFSLGLQGGLFRYIQSGLVFKIEYAPSENQGAYALKQRISTPQVGLLTDFSLTQTYESDRQAEIALTRTPVFGGPQNLSLGLKLRHKQRMGEPETQHSTYAGSFNIKPTTLPPHCTYDLFGEIENAPKELAQGFSYERKLGSALGSCNYAGRVDLALRLFGGSLYSEGKVPFAALFKPNELKEARLRVDRRDLARVKRLYAANTDLYVPFWAPVPDDTMILTRKMRWRLFYDYGKAAIEQHEYRSAGLGFLLPFGGDLSGAGSLTVTQLTALAIIYQNVAGAVIRKPSFIFDVTGQM